MDQERTKMRNSFDQNWKSTHEGQADFVQHGVVVVDIDKKACKKNMVNLISLMPTSAPGTYSYK